jgi:hypothetical protein
MNNLSKYLQLSPRDRWLLIYYVIMLIVVDLGLRFFGFQKMTSILSTQASKKMIQQQQTVEEVEEVRHTASLVEIVANRGFFRATCLRQALLVYYLLLKKGIKTELRIGISNKTKSFKSHAWIKYKDEVILGGQYSESNYSVIY